MVRRLALILAAAAALPCLAGCSSDSPIAVDAANCVNVRGDAAWYGDAVIAAVNADACYDAGGRLLSEDQSFDTLGRAAWRAPGPPIELLSITIGRSADRPLGDQPRDLPLIDTEAAARWGVHPVLPAAEAHRSFVRLASATGLIVLVLVVSVLGVVLFVALVGCLRRGEIVLIWFLR